MSALPHLHETSLVINITIGSLAEVVSSVDLKTIKKIYKKVESINERMLLKVTLKPVNWLV